MPVTVVEVHQAPRLATIGVHDIDPVPPEERDPPPVGRPRGRVRPASKPPLAASVRIHDVQAVVLAVTWALEGDLLPVGGPGGNAVSCDARQLSLPAAVGVREGEFPVATIEPAHVGDPVPVERPGGDPHLGPPRGIVFDQIKEATADPECRRDEERSQDCRDANNHKPATGEPPSPLAARSLHAALSRCWPRRTPIRRQSSWEVSAPAPETTRAQSPSSSGTRGTSSSRTELK